MLCQALVEPQVTMQPGFGVHLETFAGKPGEGAEALTARLVADADRQHGDAGRLQLRQQGHQGLGVFEAVEIPQLAQQQHQAAVARLHPGHSRQTLEQNGGGRRPGFAAGWIGARGIGARHRQQDGHDPAMVARSRNASALEPNLSRRTGSMRSSRRTIIERRGLAWKKSRCRSMKRQ